MISNLKSQISDLRSQKRESPLAEKRVSARGEEKFPISERQVSARREEKSQIAEKKVQIQDFVKICQGL
jgi:hypothetical protein